MSGIDWDQHVLGPQMEVFGKPIIFKPVVGAPKEIKGLFNESHEEVGLIDDIPTSTLTPALGVNTSDFLPDQQPKQGDLVTINETGDTYIIRDVQPDGHGRILLLLNYHH